MFFGVIVSVIFLIGIFFVFYFYKKQKNKSFNFFIVLLLWYLLGLVGLGIYKQHIYDHYFGFLFPVIFILIAIIIDQFFKLKRFGFVFGFLFLSTLISLSLLNNAFKYEPPKQLATTQKITQSIISESFNKPFNLALLAKQNYDPPYRYFLYESKAPLYDLRNKITDQLFVICEPWQIDCQPINNPQWEIAAFGWAKIDKQWDINGIKIFKLIHNK